MDWNYVILVPAQLVIAILLGALSTYLSVVLFDRATRGIDEWKELRQGNVAVGIVLGAMVIAVAGVLRPALKMPVNDWDVGTLRAIIAFGVEAAQLLIGLVLAVVSILFSVWLFDRLTTHLDEWAELEQGNVAVAILLGGVIIGVSLLIGVVLDTMFQMITPSLF